MKINKESITETITSYQISTDDIENIIQEYLGLNNKINCRFTFNWHIGQWVELSLKVTEVIELEDV